MTTDTMTKPLWLKLCAERFRMRAAIEQGLADEMALACWDNRVEDLGTDDLVLNEVAPGDAADDELSAWTGDEP